MKMYKVIAVLCLCLVISACNGNKSSEGLGDDADGRLKKASIVAKSFVEDRMGECDFEDLDYRGEETSVNNRFRVLQNLPTMGSSMCTKSIFNILEVLETTGLIEAIGHMANSL